jgi:hypothetical protein
LRFAVVVKANRVLNGYSGFETNAELEDVTYTVNGGCMPTAYRCPVDDLSVEQFDPVPRSQDTGFGHAIVIIHAVGVTMRGVLDG